MYTFKGRDIHDFSKGDGKCFVLPNGLGGYSSHSLINSSHRKHYGYLVACLKPPVDRKVILTRINEKIILEDKIYDLEAQDFKTYKKEGQIYLKEVIVDYIPTYIYEVDGIILKKRIAPVYGENTVSITYEIKADKDAKILLEPLFNYKDHGEASSKENLIFDEEIKEHLISLTPRLNKDIDIKFYFSEGKLIENKNKYSDPFYCKFDVETGDPRLDVQFIPYSIEIDLKGGETKNISIVCSIEKEFSSNAFTNIKEYEERLEKLIDNSKLDDQLAKDLVVSADAFICQRKSTSLKTILAGLPWFTDWGRDTMIAFTGLTLVTRRFSDAKEILKSFSLYEKNGLIPNMFPDDGGEPLYNTVDASLWYFYAVHKYIEYTGDKEFIKEEIYPVLKKIIKAYSTSTDFSIYMDEDGLVHAGSDQDQITWMDVRTGGVAVTPRHGKPVEINALWYNALKIMENLSSSFNEDSSFYKELSDKVKSSFNKKFICEETGCLFDVVDPNDKKIRPNQIWVLSLPYKVLDEKYAKSTFDVVTKHLYNIYGLRSLSYEDKEFLPRYEGELLKRDYTYHMGTTWGFLIGGYIDAYAYVNASSPTLKEELDELVHRFIPHLHEGCIGGIAEIFDGEMAFRTRGCYSQAWSVGELLRAYYENVLSK